MTPDPMFETPILQVMAQTDRFRAILTRFADTYDISASIYDSAGKYRLFETGTPSHQASLLKVSEENPGLLQSIINKLPNQEAEFLTPVDPGMSIGAVPIRVYGTHLAGIITGPVRLIREAPVSHHSRSSNPEDGATPAPTRPPAASPGSGKSREWTGDEAGRTADAAVGSAADSPDGIPVIQRDHFLGSLQLLGESISLLYLHHADRNHADPSWLPSASAENFSTHPSVGKAGGFITESGAFRSPLLNTLPAAVFYKDREGRFAGCNRAFSEALGVSPDDIRGKTVHDLFSGEQADLFHRKDLELLANPGLQVYECDLTDENGTARPVMCMNNIFHEEPGEPSGIIGTFVDLNSLKNETMTERHTEARYRDMFHATKAAVWEEDYSAVLADVQQLKASGVKDIPLYLDQHPEFVDQAAAKIIIRDVNEFAIEISGAGDKNELLGPLSRIMEPGLHRIIKEELSAIAEGREYYEGETEIVDLQGVLRSIRLTISFPPHPDQFDRILVNTVDISESKKSQRALEESEQRFRDMADLLPEAIFETGTNLIVTYANQTACQLFGYSTEEALSGLNGLQLIAPEDRARAEENLNQRISGSEPGTVEYRGLRKDGTVFPVLFHAGSILSSDKLVGIRGVIVDITGRKNAEEALSGSEEKYRSLVEKSLQGVIIALPDPMRLEFASQPMEEIIGFSPGELTAMKPEHLAMLLHPEDRDLFFQNFFKRIAGEMVPPRHEYRVIHKNGQIRWVEIFSSRINYEGKHAAQTVFLDITERKIIENELRSTNETLQALVHSSPSAIITLDLQANVTLWNPAAERMFGWTQSEVLGKPISIITKDDAVDFKHQLEIDKSDETRLEVQHLHRNGSQVDVSLSTAPLHDAAGNPVGVIGIFEDITQKKRAEAEKTRLEEEYRQALRVEAVGRLAGGVAHDLNNLLTPILLYSEMLFEELGDSDDRGQYAIEIMQAGTRAKDLVRQLLAFSRKQNLDYKPVDINTIIEQFGKLLRRTIREDIDIEYSLTPMDRTIFADIGQIEQVIMNLAINAQDAMPTGGKLSIHTECISLDMVQADQYSDLDPGEFIFLEIRDTGLGMSEETRLRVFEPFYSTKGSEGTGLGLATVYGIIKQHSGHIHVESQPGMGTAFMIYLPAVQGVPPDTPPSTDETLPLTGTETIILVEDNQQVRDLTCSILLKSGYEVLTASNGARGLELLESHPGPVHLLLTDVVMPEMNGRELYLKALQTRPDLKVMYMSGYSQEVIARSGVLDPEITHLQKPYTIHELRRKLKEALEGHASP